MLDDFIADLQMQVWALRNQVDFLERRMDALTEAILELRQPLKDNCTTCDCGRSSPS